MQGLHLFRGGLACAAALLVSGCAGQRLAAEALMAPVPGGLVTGRAVFAEQGAGVVLAAHVTGLGPGAHRLRLQATGGCAKPESAGGRELPLTEADAWGNAGASTVLSGLTFVEILDRTLVVESVPAGPLACGVILEQRNAP
jgi:Cu/Zn superoxide dismutase